MRMCKIRTRFAPSPTGYLHIGGLRTALYAYLFAKQRGGDFILRIEDTDRDRYVGDACGLIYKSMRDAGLAYDEGPDVGGEYGPYIQSERREIYAEHAARLVESGDAYYCFCTKENLEEMHKRGATKYDKSCQKLPLAEAKARALAGEPCVIRQNVPLGGKYTFTDLVFGEVTVDYGELEDNVLIKSDGLPTYNFANVVDDHLMEISHVIRGVEYLSSTPKYDLLYRALGWQPPVYMHVQPIMKDAQHKLSKRNGAASYSDFVGKGYVRDAIVNYIALLGWSPKNETEKFGMDFMLENFSVEGLSKSPSIFDEAKMKWLNGLYIKEMSADDYYKHALPFMEKLEYLKGYDLKFLAELLQSRTEVFTDVAPLTEFLTKFNALSPEMFEHQKNKTDARLAAEMLPDLVKLTENSFDDLFPALESFASEKGYKKSAVLWIYRIALTASAVTPGGASEMAKLLGKPECLRRLKKAVTCVK